MTRSGPRFLNGRVTLHAIWLQSKPSCLSRRRSLAHRRSLSRQNATNSDGDENVPRRLSAVVATAAQENLGNLAHFAAFAEASRRQFYLVKTRHRPAHGTQKMRVRIGTILPGTNLLEPVNMVAQFGASEQAGVGHVVQISKCRRLVGPIFVQTFGDFGVGHRRGCVTQ